VYAVAVVGAASTIGVEAAPADVLFGCVSDALRQAGLRKQDVDLSAVASRDLYDACSMSNGQMLPAAAGWLAGSVTRLETDVSAALVVADAVLRSGDAEVAVVAGVHQPQVPDGSRRKFDAQVSNLAAEPIYERPTGMTGTSLLAMHAARLIADAATTQRVLAETAAGEITLGATSRHATRTKAASADDVLAAAPVAWPLTELMLPAETTGAVALVLATPERARALGGARAHLVAHGMSAGGGLGTGDWLSAPQVAAKRAAEQAYRRAGVIEAGREFDVAELTAPSPAMREPLVHALGLGGLANERISPSGGVRSSFPGVANGALRLLEAVEWLERNDGRRALVHSVDTLTGPMSATTTVTVLERR
jgi:hypothetical protein